MIERILQALKLSLSKIYRFRFRVLAAALALALLLCVLHYITNSNESYATMSLNYSEASSGLNPNSTRFNISELISKNVMEKVVQTAGLENEITWEELSRCISASAADSSSKSDNYISTSYTISYNQKSIKDKSNYLPNADDMLKLICTTYKRYFLENYGDNKSILSYVPLVKSDSEPYISLSSLEVKLDQIKRYLNMRMKENKSYTDEETGINFISLLKDVENLSNYDIVNTYSYILETGISKDRDTLVSLESYKNRIDTLSYDKYMAFYDSDNNGIKLYDEAMSAIVMIPSVDKIDEYYMSRTKTATDSMAKNADAELKEGSSYSKVIADTNFLISQINKGNGNNKEYVNTAVSMIVDLSKSINKIAEQLKLLDVSYIKHKTQSYLVFGYSERSFIQKIDVKMTITQVLAAVIGYYLVLVVYTFRKESKRKRDKNAKV